MKLMGSVAILASVLAAPSAIAGDWRKELAAPLVKIAGGKMIYEEFELCSGAAQEGTETSSIEVRTRSEAPNSKFISRDNFVALTAAMSMELLEQFGDLDCKTLDAPIGAADVEITFHMAEAGMQVEVSNTGTGQKSRSTMRWEDLFAE